MGDEMPVLCVALLAGSFDLGALRSLSLDLPMKNRHRNVIFILTEIVEVRERQGCHTDPQE